MDGMTDLPGETFAHHMQNLVEALNTIGECAKRAVETFSIAAYPVMHELETKYPEILNDDGSWRDDWAEIIRALPKRSDMLQ